MATYFLLPGDDRWNLNNIHYMRLFDHVEMDRPVVFGRRNRWERLKRLKSGLDKASRKLMTQMRPCHVKVERLCEQRALANTPPLTTTNGIARTITNQSMHVEVSSPFGKITSHLGIPMGFYRSFPLTIL